jgi:hypothetical protein
VAAWIFYRYFAPRSWREWTRAGIVQAFIAIRGGNLHTIFGAHSGVGSLFLKISGKLILLLGSIICKVAHL